MKRIRIFSGVTLAIITASLVTLFGCGGGSGSSTAVTPGTPRTQGAQGMLGGAAIKGPVSGATVTAYGIMSGMTGTEIASAMTDSQGNFTMTIGSYSGPMLLTMSGGTYIDEATGTTMSMAAGDMMTAAVPSISSGETITGIQMTPLTAMAQTMAEHITGGMTAANIAAANTAVGNYFMVNDILHTPPMNPLVSGSGSTATQDMINYGMALAAISEYAKEMGMTSSSAMVAAMMDDSSDGVMNGMMGATSISMGSMSGGMMGGGSTMMQSSAGTTGLATAMTSFMTSTTNMSGLTATDMNALIQKLSSSNGQML